MGDSGEREECVTKKKMMMMIVSPYHRIELMQEELLVLCAHGGVASCRANY